MNDDHLRRRDIGVARAAGIQFDSGRNILRFYLLRQQLLAGPGDAATLAQLRAIVHKEIQNSQQLITLCEDDPTLGFNPSECETYKYFPAKLQWRIDQLRQLLAESFPAVEARLQAQRRIPGRLANQPEYTPGQGWVENEHFRWRLDKEGEDLVIRFDCHMTGKRWAAFTVSLLDEYGTHWPWLVRLVSDKPVATEDWAQVTLERKDQDAMSGVVRLPALAWWDRPQARPGHVGLQLFYIEHGQKQFAYDLWPRTGLPPRNRHRVGVYDPRQLASLRW